MQISSFHSKGRIIFFTSALVALLLYILISFGQLSVKKVPIFTPPAENVERGTILDRNGKTLAVQERIDEIKALYKKMQDNLMQRQNYVDFGNNTNVNMDKLYKVAKVISPDETYYKVHFTDGQIIEMDYIDDDAKHRMKYGKKENYRNHRQR